MNGETPPNVSEVLGRLSKLEHCLAGLSADEPGVAGLRGVVLYNVTAARYIANVNTGAEGADESRADESAIFNDLDTLDSLAATRLVLLRVAVELSRCTPISPTVAKRLASLLWSHTLACSDHDVEPPAETLWLASATDIPETAGECEIVRRILLARCCHAAKEFDQASVHIDELAPDCQRAYLLRADLCLRRGNPACALDTVLSAMERESDHTCLSRMHNVAGCCYAQLGNSAAAAVSFCHAIQSCYPHAYTAAAFNCAAVQCDDEPTVMRAAADLRVMETLRNAVVISGGARRAHMTSPYDFDPDTASQPVTVLATLGYPLQTIRDIITTNTDDRLQYDDAVDALLRHLGWLALLSGNGSQAESYYSLFFASRNRSCGEMTASETLRRCAVAKFLQNKLDQCLAICARLSEFDPDDTDALLIRVASCCELEQWDVVTALVSDLATHETEHSPLVECWIAVVHARCAVAGHASPSTVIDRLRSATLRCPGHRTSMEYLCHFLRTYGDDRSQNEAAVNWTVNSEPLPQGKVSPVHNSDSAFSVILSRPLPPPDGFLPSEMNQWAIERTKALLPSQISILAIDDVLHKKTPL